MFAGLVALHHHINARDVTNDNDQGLDYRTGGQ